jgi:hypothetical protein
MVAFSDRVLVVWCASCLTDEERLLRSGFPERSRKVSGAFPEGQGGLERDAIHASVSDNRRLSVKKASSRNARGLLLFC